MLLSMFVFTCPCPCGRTFRELIVRPADIDRVWDKYLRNMETNRHNEGIPVDIAMAIIAEMERGK